MMEEGLDEGKHDGGGCLRDEHHSDDHILDHEVGDRSLPADGGNNDDRLGQY